MLPGLGEIFKAAEKEFEQQRSFYGRGRGRVRCVVVSDREFPLHVKS